ncbi:MAG: hypothetical protein JWQ74_1059 [Marmoricola sp.]|nr:hypothetical protein [Marmoricola sp.]
MLEIAVALAIAVGLVGVLVPMLPGGLLVGAAILGWALVRADTGSWTTFGVAATLLLTGSVTKYLVPGRRLQRHGVPNSTLLFGGALGIVGFFVLPVIGLPLGFVLGVYLAERRRRPHAEAWPATVAALRAVGLGIMIELGFGTLAAAAWAIGAIVT